MKTHSLSRLAAGLAVYAVLSCTTQAQFSFVTNFAKTNNIYTNLNEQFPHSGTGTPGSGVGTANASFLFDPTTYSSPNALAGANTATNGATFQITSDASGHDFAEINSGQSLVIPVGQQASSVYLLMSAYDGVTATVTFTGADNATETFSGVSLPDFNGGSPINTSAMINGSTTYNAFDQTVFRVQDTGAGGSGNSTNGAFNTYNLVEPSFVLNPQLAGEQLTSISITSNGYMTLLLGVTVAPVPEPATVAALAGAAVLGFALWRRRRRHGTP
ncbi:MAG: PEP-CTERM sorting domain-containing protein [Opitutales bacterium]